MKLSKAFWDGFLDGLSLNPVRHWLAHTFGINYGRVYIWLDDEKIMVGFRCDGCDRIDGVHESRADCMSSAGPKGCYRERCQLGGKCLGPVSADSATERKS